MFTFLTETHDYFQTSNAQCDEKLDGADTLTREQKFEVFVTAVCDNMLTRGKNVQSKSYTLDKHLVR